MSTIEQPHYTRIQPFSTHIESRLYAPMHIAQVEVEADSRKEAINQGFRMIARYIFGDNTAQDKIAMTSPVQQTRSTKTADHTAWKISFVMPSKFTLDTLPKPHNTDIQLLAVPEQRFIVIRFSGLMSQSNLDKHEKILRNAVKKNNLSTIGEVKYAFYNPPWTLPVFRRNEVMLQLAD